MRIGGRREGGAEGEGVCAESWYRRKDILTNWAKSL